MSGQAEGAEEGLDAVDDLLEDVRLAVGNVKDDIEAGRVDRRLVGREAEGLAGEGEKMGRPGLGAAGEVVIGGVVPAAAVEAGHVLVRGERRLRLRALFVALDEGQVEARRGLEGVVHVAGAVPDPAAVDDPDVAHLDGQERLQGRLPDVVAVDIGRDEEGGGLRLAEADDVGAGLADGGEVEDRVIVAQEASPTGDGPLERRDEAFRGIDPEERRRGERVRARIELDDGALLLAPDDSRPAICR